uniref:Pru domain-containing protein n=1 Tax=Suricata suricatta TaxID=37032 RepID=A0A673TN10_SURSU
MFTRARRLEDSSQLHHSVTTLLPLTTFSAFLHPSSRRTRASRSKERKAFPLPQLPPGHMASHSTAEGRKSKPGRHFSARIVAQAWMMTSGALFPSLVPGSWGSSHKYLVEFRAGKKSLKGTTVTPDRRKGLVYIHSADDSLIHFCWKDTTSGNVEDDLIIFPDDCEFKRVPQCPV